MTQRPYFICLIVSFLFIGDFAYTQKAQLQYLSKVGVIDSLRSDVLDETRDFYVQLPQSYDANSAERYPVVYILDGDVLLPAASIVHDYYHGGFMPEMVLVGISNAQNRTRDLTTSSVTTRFGMPFNEDSGQASTFMEFIEKELIPHIEDQYHVSNYRTLIGHSYGGLFCINALLNHTDLFSNYLSIDPSLDWDDQKLLSEAHNSLSLNDYSNKALFMTLGGQLHMQDPHVTIDNVMEDKSNFTLFARSNIALANDIKANKKNHLSFDWKYYARELHGTIPLISIMDGLISLFNWYQMELTDKFNSPDTPKEELYDIVRYRAEKLKNNFGYPVAPYPEDLLNTLGYMNMDMEQNGKAKMFFELTVEYYPNSANANDSMAEYYESQKDYSSALVFAKKAAELNNDEYYKNRLEEIKSKN